MKYLHGLHILILGLGDSGLAMARWAARCGAAGIRVADTREAPPQAAKLHEDVPAATLHHGLSPELLGTEGAPDAVNLVLKSPGLSPLDAQLAPLLACAEARGIPVRGELSLFATALADLKDDLGYQPKVLAITGTNGKTTTTTLTARLCERAGKRVGLAGNIGPTLLDTLAAALDLQATVQAEGEAVPAGDAPTNEQPVAGSSTEPAEAALQSGTEAEARVTPEGDASEAANDAAIEGDAAGPGDATAGEPAVKPGHHLSEAEIEAAATALAEEDAPLPIAPPPPPPPEFEHLPQVWVLELSSFQLDGVTNFEPSAAAVLNITQDHLDWHGTMPAYAQAKARIFGRQGVLVINRDDEAVEALVPAPEVIKGAKGRPGKTVARKVVRFGLDAPQRPGDFGLVVEGGIAWLVRAMESDETIKRRKDEEEEIVLQRLMPADALRIRGRHNASNALAALALATSVGLPLGPMLHGLREYLGEPHRVEHIGVVKGVHAYDDSKGTNVGATVAALRGLGAEMLPSRLVVILGGDGKGQDFAPLADPVGRYVRAAALIGRDAGAIEQALAGAAADASITLQRHDTLEAATRWAFEQARAGDAVLLSPACASLDMFRNYAHRAQVFIDTVRAIADEAGEVTL